MSEYQKRRAEAFVRANPERVASAIPIEQCFDHEDKEPGEDHLFRDGNIQTLKMCLPDRMVYPT